MFLALSLAVGLLGAWPQTAWAAELSDQPAVNATSSAQVVGPTGPTATTTTETANGQTTVVQSTIADLVNNGTYMNGGTYSVEGEVIGDILNADADHVWFTLSDGGKSISAYCSRADAAQINYLGRYQVQGDIVQVTAVFNVACVQHDGTIDLHVTSLKVVEPGYQEQIPANTFLLLIGAVMIVFGGILVLIYRHLRERQR